MSIKSIDGREIVFGGGLVGEENTLRSCYAECLRLAKQYKCKSVAFPLISSGVYGFPKDRVLRIAAEPMLEKMDRIKVKYGIAE